jgi:hypothetical protein
MVLNMKCWKWLAPFEAITIESAFLKCKLSLICKLSITYMQLWHFQVGPTSIQCL